MRWVWKTSHRKISPPTSRCSGEGLGLDSVDALELGLAIQKRFGIKIDADAKDTRKHFASVDSLADYVSANRAVA